ncbi:hypothetical protein N624_1497 [Levilactobacillus brevis]|nr:hypothetical protein N624_1497 [Levilactobacillus brevis]
MCQKSQLNKHDCGINELVNPFFIAQNKKDWLTSPLKDYPT